MAWPMKRRFDFNMNTRSTSSPILRRNTLDAQFAPRRPKGIRQPGTNYITLLEARTPQPGTGDPRILGNYHKYQTNTMTITD
jgi:hypothetical protein